MTSSRLLALPVELRLEMYRHLLVQDTPIDFSPLSAPDSRDLDFLGSDPFEKLPFSYDNSASGMRHDAIINYRRRICPNLALLSTCKKLHEEAAPVFYGHNQFRFTSQFGWVLANAFAGKIGRANFGLIRHLTLPTPFARDMSGMWDDSFPHAGGNTRGYLSKDVRQGLDEELDMYDLSIPASHNYAAGGEEQIYHPHFEAVVRVCNWLGNAKQLRVLYIVTTSTAVPSPGVYMTDDDFRSYSGAIHQPWELPRPERPLTPNDEIPCLSMWAWLSRLKHVNPKLVINATVLHRCRSEVRPGDPDMPIAHDWLTYNPEDTVPVAKKTRTDDFDEQARELGWPVSHVFYDRRGRYPVEDPGKAWLKAWTADEWLFEGPKNIWCV